MKARSLFVSVVLLLLLASGAFGDGAFQRTKDGKTLVWNPDTHPEDAARWSGSRDTKRYATGQGTLTWYKIERRYGMGSHVPVEKEILVIRYSGNMVHGKFEGPVVAVDEQGKTSHATFAGGVRSDEWTSDLAPRPSSPSVSPGESALAAKPSSTANPTPNEPIQKPKEPIPQGIVVKEPRETPVPAARPVRVQELHDQIVHQEIAANSPSLLSLQVQPPGPPVRGQPAAESFARPTAPPFPTRRSTRNRSVDAHDLLQSLAVPPSTIGTLMKIRGESPSGSPMPETSASPTPASLAPASPASGPRLTSAEVIGLADAEAHSRGYELGAYQRPQAQYVAANETWSVSYGQKSEDGRAEPGKHFSVRIEDKTKKTSIDR